MCWDDLYAVIYAAPPGTAMFHAVEMGWTTGDYHAATMIDILNILAWQNTEDAHAKPPRGQPKPITRPGQEPAEDSNLVSIGTGVATLVPLDEFIRMREERQQRWRETHQKGA